MLHGFYISHFRNFGDTPHLVGPLGKISVFIGGNNAGKSNILRYVRDIISPLYNNQRDRPAEAIGINQSRFSSTPQSAVKVLVKVTDETIASAFGSENSNLNASFLDFYRNLPGSVGSEYTAVPILKSQSSSNERIATAELDSEGVGEGVAKQIWSTGGQSGGGFQQHWYPFTLQKLFDAQRTNVDCVYVPAFRQLDTRLERFSHEYRHVAQSEHVIDELASFAYPTYEDQQKKQSFEKLRSFIAEIVGNPDVRVEIPHDRSTINIDLDGQVLPVEALGSGIHELVMLASRVVLNEGKIILLEEPEVHMHPEFQRKFMSFIRDKIDSQFFITTHSSVVIDTDGVAVFGVSKKDGQGYVAPLLSDQSRREMCRELGYRASDLLQANSIVWVEGPSDRIYLKHWLNAAAPELREGIEFSIMFYGGKMLSHLSGEDDAELQDFIALLPINRYPAVLMDSDLGSATQSVRPTKQRILNELQSVGGLSWITQGREVENYIPIAMREAAVKAVHKRAANLIGSATRFGKPLDYKTETGKEVTEGFDKVKIARIISQQPADFSQLDLRANIDNLVSFIRRSNSAG